MKPDPEIARLLQTALADPLTGWTLGTYGALAEFRRAPGEGCTEVASGEPGLLTARGGIGLKLRPDLVPVAYETWLGGDDWSHAVALCLPDDACTGPARAQVTELGPDAGSLRRQDRDAVLFDLGFGLAHAVIGVRARTGAALTRLRAWRGRPAPNLWASGEPSPDLDWVISGPIGRIEVFADAPRDADGPRAVVVPRILRLRRTHAATAPIPAGLLPCCHVLPPHPCRGAAGARLPFDAKRHASFQALLARWGDPRLAAVKRHAAGQGPPPGPADRWSRGAERVARAQARHAGAAGA
ncbi:DUF6925 family protein [Methylobacterium nigriterrae]|uniref:DUF6925 family protein n=1 Tax=Methylobacterium nigriterrae TaxID=3127512 RepID=UPI003014197E